MEESNIDRPFLMGDKIYLRPLDIDDVNDTYLNWINDGEVINNLATVFPSSREDLTNFVSNHIKNRNFVFFAIIEKQSNKHIGNAKLGPIDWISRTSNYGIMIGDKNSWGKGYAQETHALALKYAFEKINLHKIWDIAVDANVAAIKVMDKLGFKIEAKLEKHVFKNGKYRDVSIHSVLAEDYFNRMEK